MTTGDLDAATRMTIGTGHGMRPDNEPNTGGLWSQNDVTGWPADADDDAGGPRYRNVACFEATWCLVRR